MPSSWPDWASWIVAAAAVATAAGVLWSKVVRPLLAGLARVGAMAGVLHEVAEQVRNDSGSSLLDTVQRIDRAVDAIIERAQFDREQVAAQTRYVELVADRINDVIDRVAEVTASGERQEAGAVVIAADLAASHARSDAVVSGEPGAAADAGAQS